MRTTFALGLALGMLVTGSINTISTKLADLQVVSGLDPKTPHSFNHPFFQAGLMFLGESLCLIVYNTKKAFFPKKRAAGARPSDSVQGRASGRSAQDYSKVKQSWSPLIFLIPACCDMTGTSLMYVGLNLTSASVFQMLRGSVVLFTGIFSIIFLGRKLYCYHWTGMLLVLIGAAVVGVASVLYPDENSKSASNPLLGDILIVVAQVVTAVQMVVEEKLVNGKGIPALQAVGWEGVWGFLVLSCGLVGMYFAPGVPAFSSGNATSSDHFENTPDAIIQMSNSGPLFAACLGNVLSIAFFNFFGLSVTKHMSATHRMVLDSLRTIIIWIVGIACFGENFNLLQLGGFVILLLGTLIYNQVVHLPCLSYKDEDESSSEGNAPLLPSSNSGDQETGRSAEGEEDLAAGLASPKMDDFFSPKLTHYTQGRAM